MNTTKGRVLAVVAAAAVLVAGVQVTAYAKTGRPWLLGRSNAAAQTTTLASTAGRPALKLVTRTGVAPMVVTSTRRVDRFNADAVDGLSAASLQTRSRRFVLPKEEPRSSISIGLPGLAPGWYQVSYWVIAQLAEDDDVLGCFLADNSQKAGGALLYQSMPESLGYAEVNGAGLVRVPSQGVTFFCNTFGGKATFDAPNAGTAPSDIVFTRVDGVTSVTGRANAAGRQKAPALSGR